MEHPSQEKGASLGYEHTGKIINTFGAKRPLL
jgi:hypothetical protein